MAQVADVRVVLLHDEAPDSTNGGKQTGRQVAPLARELGVDEQVPNAPLKGAVGVHAAVTCCVCEEASSRSNSSSRAAQAGIRLAPLRVMPSLPCARRDGGAAVQLSARQSTRVCYCRNRVCAESRPSHLLLAKRCQRSGAGGPLAGRQRLAVC
jgi:hypothetical protein